MTTRIADTKFEAVVTDIREHSRERGQSVWQISLDRSAFRADALGTLQATARSGASIEIPVIAVEEVDGEVWHTTEKPLLPGVAVVARLYGN